MENPAPALAGATGPSASAEPSKPSDPVDPVEPAEPTGPTVNQLWGPEWPAVRASWDLDHGYAHLNHGSFGAVPRAVREAQRAWVHRSDENPVGFYREEMPQALVAARRAAAAFCGSDPDGLALVANTTAGVSALLASYPLGTGDEILVTDHAYGAVHKAALRRAHDTGASLVVARLTLGADDDQLVAELLEKVTDRTRIALVDQVTSPTAMLLPVAAMAAALRPRGVSVLVDGAHAPGMLPIDVTELGVDFWVGNFHKWAFASRTVAGLWVAPRWRDLVRPLVVSWGEDEPYPAPFDQQGTLDLSSQLALPDALEFGERLGWDRVRRHNAALVTDGQHAVAEALRVDLGAVERRTASPGAPVPAGAPAGGMPGAERYGLSMALVPLPDRVASVPAGAGALTERIHRELRVEPAITRWRDRVWLRLSAQVYNAPEEYERFGWGLARLLER